MRQLIIFLASSAVLIGLVVWGSRPGNHVPTWLYLLAAAPLMWFQVFGGKKEDATSTTAKIKQGAGILYLLGAGIFLMLIGLIGGAMPGAVGEFLAPALPLGGGAFLLGLLAIFLRPRK